MEGPRDYLCVDRFLPTELDVRALSYALSSGLIDTLCERPCAFSEIPIGSQFGRRLLVDLLTRNGVVLLRGEGIELSTNFKSVLAFRDLLEAKIDFATCVAPDIAEHFAALIGDLPAFMAKSRTFALFRYDRCFVATDANLAATRRWVRFTTALTRYEGRVLASLLDLSAESRVMDVGGNSGELGVQLCRAHPALRVLVVDLPVVCEIGRQHVATTEVADRIAFRPCDMRREPLPDGYRAIVFKSVLHDWPDADAHALLRKARAALPPDGRLVIFERGPMRFDDNLTFGQLPNLAFAAFYRAAAFYEEALQALHFVDIRIETVALDMDFHLITARCPNG